MARIQDCPVTGGALGIAGQSTRDIEMAAPGYRFANRRQAGRALAQSLRGLALADPVVLALPRGGVPVAYEIARALHAPLDILLVRKIGAPGHKEYGIGAIVDGAAPQLVLDKEAARAVGASDSYVEQAVREELAEIERRRSAYQATPPLSLHGRTVVLADDGIATGGTVMAALKGLALARPARIILAVPVAPADSLAALQPLCDDIVCLATPRPFLSVGMHYDDFAQTDDSEVIQLLKLADAANRQDRQPEPAGDDAAPDRHPK